MTREEFMKILPAYMGNYAKNLKGEILKIDEITHKGGMISYTPDHVFFAAVGEFTLLLRRVEDMTEEEYDVLGEILNYFRLEVAEFTSVSEICEGFHNYTSMAKAINYLRSIGVDCDNLLDTEWAELKTNK